MVVISSLVANLTIRRHSTSGYFLYTSLGDLLLLPRFGQSISSIYSVFSTWPSITRRSMELSFRHVTSPKQVNGKMFPMFSSSNMDLLVKMSVYDISIIIFQ